MQRGKQHKSANTKAKPDKTRPAGLCYNGHKERPQASGPSLCPVSYTHLLGALGGLLSPLFAPLGFADWRVSTALITGFTAKEAVVSTLAVLTGSSLSTLPQALAGLFSPFTAFVFLIFTLLYTPCVAAIAAVKREMGGAKAAAGVALAQCLIAWLAAFAVRCIGLVFGLV